MLDARNNYVNCILQIYSIFIIILLAESNNVFLLSDEIVCAVGYNLNGFGFFGFISLLCVYKRVLNFVEVLLPDVCAPHCWDVNAAPASLRSVIMAAPDLNSHVC